MPAQTDLRPAAGAITSLHNPQVKAWLALRRTQPRRATGLFLVEGARAVGEALKTAQEIAAVLYCPALMRSTRAWELLAQAPPARVRQVSVEVMQHLSTRDRPGELLAVCRQMDVPLAALPAEGRPFVVVLDEPHGPGNLGTAIRVADGAGASALVIVQPAVDLYHPAVVSTSVGSLFALPIARATSRQAFLDWYDPVWGARAGTLCVASEPGAVLDYSAFEPGDGPIFVVFGNEERGIAAELRKRCDQAVAIQLHGRADSLSLASAVAVIVCHVAARRR